MEAGGTERVCLITGANSGVGKATAKELAARGLRVVMVCRGRGRGAKAQAEIRRETGSEAVDLLLADLASQEEIRALAGRFLDAYDRLDVLINNAGVYLASREETEDGIEKTFAVNHLAPFLLTNLLLERLKATAAEAGEARILNVTSEAHRDTDINWEDLTGERGYSGMKAYAQSKLANVLFTYELARRLEGTSITVNCVHPGMVATRIWNRNYDLGSLLMRLVKPFMTRPSTSGKALAYLAAAPELEGVTGRYFDQKEESRSSDVSYDEEEARRLWRVSAEMTGVSISEGRRDR